MNDICAMPGGRIYLASCRVASVRRMLELRFEFAQ